MIGIHYTILHWLILCISLVIILFLIYLVYLKAEQKSKITLYTITFLSILTLTYMSFHILDGYTKQVELVKFKNKRNLLNETIVFSGFAKNVGRYEVKEVYLEVRLRNEGMGTLASKTFFSPSGFFKKENYRPTTTTTKVLIAENLKPKNMTSFQVNVPFPPYFTKTSIEHDVIAH
ncbi:MAG: DUF2393 domain-containing protein [Helicobacteraceae bacterium]|nr:DUF2393 domain-containing protein [Helicobacteraceae bacterium]